MTDPAVLKHFGCSNERLREIFVTPCCSEPCPPDADEVKKAAYEKQQKNYRIRKKFEDEIRSNMLEGVATNARNSRPCQAVDMAWDAPPISKETVPLLLWAMGKIDVPRLWDVLEREVGATTAATFLKKDPTSGELLKPAVPRICDVKIDVVRSYITRSLAAMDSLWANQWPLLRYEPRGTEAVAMLRSDALTQRVDIMSDAYGYRHQGTQWRRDMLLYGQSIVFPRTAWDRQISWRFKASNTGEPSKEVESYITREGLDLVNPHPNRVAYDMSAPLASINTDTGPRWIFYWDITRFRNLYDDPKYFNLDQIWFSEDWTQLTAMYPEFFGYYFDPCVLQWPDVYGNDPSLMNDRPSRIGIYASKWKDKGVLVLPYFKKINPKVEGIGDYDADVWVKLVVAGDNTVIGAEWLPSIPCAYGAINWNDGKVANQSMGMALLGYQDQASNIMSHMLQQLRSSLVQLWLIDTDSLDPEVVKSLEKNAANADWWVDAKVLKYSAKKLAELGIQDPRQAFAIVQNNIQNVLQNGFTALGQLFNTADRMLVLSPNELGQPNPREVAAREVQEIANSVQAVAAFKNEGPREQIAALKEMIYDSLITCAEETVRLPVEGRYTKKVIKAAGFTVPDDVDEETKDNQAVPVGTPIMGSLKNLRYDYNFNSRDGAERTPNTKGAQAIAQVLAPLMQDPEMRAALGKKRLFGLINTMLRMSDAPINTQIQIADGEEDEMPVAPQGVPAGPPQAGGASAPGTDARIARLEQIIMEMAKAQGQMPAQQAAPPNSPAAALAPPVAA
jgi:hypothetical protein